MIQITPSNLNSVRVPPLSEFDFSVTLSPVDFVIEPGEQVILDRPDAKIKRTTDSLVRRDAVLSSGLDLGVPLALKSLNTDLAQVEDGNYIRSVGTGAVEIIAVTPALNRKATHHAALSDGGAIAFSLVEYNAGTFGRAIFDTVASRVPASIDVSMLSQINHGIAQYSRNPNFWPTGFDFSGVKIWDSGTLDFRRGATPLSRRHVLMANHYRVPNNSQVRYLTQSNEVVTRTLLSAVRIGTTDISIGVLNEDLPQEIASYPILPANWQDYLKTLHTLPNLTFNQDGFGYVTITKYQDPFSAPLPPSVWTQRRLLQTQEAGNPWLPATGGLRVLDSGQPNFILTPSGAVLTGCHHLPQAHPNPAAFAPEIQAAMDALATGYALQIADLSAFPTF